MSTRLFDDDPPSARSVLDFAVPTMRFQPIVDLTDDTCPVVAFESLARWPGLPDLRVGELFERTGGADLDELDWVCRMSTVETMRRMTPGTAPTVFVNVEPTSWHTPPLVGGSPGTAAGGWDDAGDLPLVLEVTERQLTARPADLLRVVAAARERGWRVALDDVGARRASLAMIDLVRPDVVKLDMSVLHPDSGPELVRTLMDVHAYCERTGAVILAEGIESLRLLETARSIGARLGQGWAFGRPGPLRVAERPIILPAPVDAIGHAAPFGLLQDGAPVRTARRALLASLTYDIEQHALEQVEPPIVLAAFQHADNITATVRTRYERIAARSPFTAMLGADMPALPVPGVVGLTIDSDDPLTDEWTVVVLSPQYCAALIAQDLGDTGPRERHRFRWSITHDRELVTSAARTLLARAVVPRRA